MFIKHRVNCDDKKNNAGNRLIDFCKFNDLFICNGRTGHDKSVGKLTCKNASVVDYVLCSSKLVKNIDDFEILDFNSLLSDVHCPISFTLHFDDVLNTTISCNNPTKMEEGINKWKAEKAVDFVNNIDDDSIKYITDLINNCNDPLELNIDELIDKCCNILLHAAKNSLGINIKKRNVNNKSVASNKPWFDLNCKKARKTYRQCKVQYRRRRNEYFYNKYKESEKAYKYTMNKSIKTYKYDVRKKLETMKSKNPRDYWKLLKGNGNRKPKGKIPLDTFFNFYKDLNASVDDGITDLHEGHDGPINEFFNSDITKD
ncbi:uncharacterized protein LOC117325053 [Pecten maximus]|uniref:uncharacterized protein LOC117325053 n=1 Tax=Pecten maximus TaxID=6579 RepID=UPI001457F8BA|nr:uncharacterized protein LOC117325053 [Pecten maximus]